MQKDEDSNIATYRRSKRKKEENEEIKKKELQLIRGKQL